MYSALDILNIAQNRDLQDLGQFESDTGQQLNQAYTLGNGMEGGFGANEQTRLRNEVAQSKADVVQNYNVKRQIIQERERLAKEAAEKQKKAALLQGIGGVVSGASSFLGPVGGMIGGAVGQGISAAGQFEGDQPINIDWSMLDNRWRKWRKPNV